MKNKPFSYSVYFIIVLSLIFFILYGSILRHHYTGGKKFPSIQKVAVFFAEIPSNVKFMITYKTLDGDVIKPSKQNEDLNQENTIIFDKEKFFKKKINDNIKKDELILVARHDGNLGRSVVELRDVNTFKILHSYLPDMNQIYDNIDMTKPKSKQLKSEFGINRIQMSHPEINSDGGLIFIANGPLVKINQNGKVIWINFEQNYHHSINTDLEGNIYVCSVVDLSDELKKYIQPFKKLNPQRVFNNDAISILDKDGNLIFSKSVSDILVENGYSDEVFTEKNMLNFDPIHLNDIQPVLEDTPFFKKGDLFLSSRSLNAIILYRPSNNKIIKVIRGFFKNQHDVDIIDDRRISIYNNNVILDVNSKTEDRTYNQLLIYNFETDGFSIKFQDTFIENKVNTHTAGLSEFLEDGSIIVEDTNNNRILYINSNEEVVWEFNNINSKNDPYFLSWARIIDSEKSKKLRKLFNKS